jgi:hypothetical protein
LLTEPVAPGQRSGWHNIGPELLLVSEDGLRMSVPGLTVQVRLPDAPAFVRSVQQQKELEGWQFRDGRLAFTTDLEWADYIILAE